MNRLQIMKQVLLLWILLHTAVCVADENNKHQQKLNTISRLLSESSVSVNILNSHNDVAIQYYNLAKTAYEHAVAEFEHGNIEKSNVFIKKATDALSDATMLANMNNVDKNLEVEHHHYNDTKKSVDALLLAVKRVIKEKGVVEESSEMLQQIDQLNTQVQQYADKEQYAQASEELDKILFIIRRNIIELKMGDTLVRTLTFATPKEEFRYEIDRSDAHFILLKTFLPDQETMADGKSVYKKDIQRAHELRKKAETYAKDKDYKQAIATLEQSTGILLKVIRMTGAEIPG